MAATKTENPVITEPTMVSIRIPKTKPNQGDVFVSVNERTWQIQRNVTVEVPDYVALMLGMRDDTIERNMNALPDE